jgi:hypothetical protein
MAAFVFAVAGGCGAFKKLAGNLVCGHGACFGCTGLRA